MTFANPSYLWAFAGLAIPLAIHLLSRKEGKVIRVGSIRHVEESNTSQFKSIRLNEVLLLLLRSLMVTMVVMFLSGAQCTNPPGADPAKWLMVETGIENNPDHKAQIDSLSAAGFDLHPLPKGEYWSVAKQLGELPYDIVVISYSRAEGFNGERIDLPDNIRWISAEQPSRRFPATAWQAGDSIFVRSANSTALSTSYTTSLGLPDSIEVIKPGSIKVSIEQNDKTALVTAAISVLRHEFKLPITIGANADQRIVFKDDTGSLVERISKNEIGINSRLDQDIALNENLVVTLFKTLYPELNEPAISKLKDARTMPDQLAWSESTAGDGSLPASSQAGIEKYLIVLFIVSLAAERFVAFRRNQ